MASEDLVTLSNTVVSCSTCALILSFFNQINTNTEKKDIKPKKKVSYSDKKSIQLIY